MFAANADTNEMLKAILRSIDEGIHVIDKNGRTIYYNQIAADHDGMKVAEVIGKALLEVFPSLTTSTSTLLKVIESGQPIYNEHQTYLNVRGELIDTVNTTIPIIVDGNIVGAAEIAKDYSRVKELSKKLIELQTEKDTRREKPKTVSKYSTMYRFDDILTKDPVMKMIISKAKKVARTSSPILVYGETGTGKELLVQSIHHQSLRSDGPFISQNCAAIPSSLLESMLFGTVKGSFTGAENKEGLFELAHGGTLFLDEIHTLPFDLQAKLLRVLENGVIRRVGSHKSVQTDVRIITATNEKPENLVQNELLRKDLYYRLNVVSFYIPPLRKRPDDLTLLTDFFIGKYNREFNMNVKGFDTSALIMLQRYDWPGNIRELRNVIESAMNVTETDVLSPDTLPVYLESLSGRTADLSGLPAGAVTEQGLKKSMEEIERKIIMSVFEQENSNVMRAAKKLKIPRQTLQYKLTKYGCS